MKAGSVIRIPDAVASRTAGREVIQPGLPGRWSIWSQAAGAPGAHFAVPIDAAARETGVKYATVRITKPQGETERVQLIATDPAVAMPKPVRAA
ncbi:hypothetical protein [Nocardioides soli]|uniref:Uncharacterized protein n=1 Tax=Nocardioides soli TaxID=1036020 RepID=A0A7W4VSI5_9ACTN|nr:hypothetical protein [Nocardioides soli]MBB3040990.1 hypothetical protein [Nocardioides soli]